MAAGEQASDQKESGVPPEGAGPYVPALRFDWLTWAFDPLLRLTTREQAFKEQLLAQAGLRGGMDVLDLGCGTGTLALLAKSQTPEANLTGLDGDPKVLARARKKAKEARSVVRFDQGFSYDLPYEDESFDRALSSLFFHHLARGDKERTLAEVRRVLRPGGELHVADWGAPAGSLMKVLSLSIRLFDGPETTRDNLEGRLPQLFEEGGFEQIAVCAEMATIYGSLAFYSADRH